MPDILRKDKNEFYEAQPRKDVTDHIQKEAHKYSGREILLCFTCDPYQPLDKDLALTRKAIQVLHDHRVVVRILTKGGLRAVRDFDLLINHRDLSIFGITLTFDNARQSREAEPWAAIPEDRIESLRTAHDMGIRTWASLEPVMDPDQSLSLIIRSAEWVDEFKIGKLNHVANKIDWKSFGKQAVALMKKLDKRYYLKKDLLAFLPGEPQRG